MLTRSERETVLERERNKIVNMLRAKYPLRGDDVEDAVHGAVYSAAFKEFESDGRFVQYLIEKSTFIMIDVLELECERRKIKQGLPKTVRKRDPMKEIDWKIDLERAIKEAVWDDKMRAAMWHHIYEGYTQEEVADMAGCDQATVSRAVDAVNKVMQRKGYHG